VQRFRETLDWQLSGRESQLMVTRALPGDLPAGEYVLMASVKSEGLQADATAMVIVAVEALATDDFSDPSSGWFEGAQDDVITRYQDGGYRMTVVAPDILTFYWQRPWRDAGDVALELDAAALSTALTEYGLAVDVSASGREALLLRVANSGMFKVTRRSGDVLGTGDRHAAQPPGRGAAGRPDLGLRQRPAPARPVGLRSPVRLGRGGGGLVRRGAGRGGVRQLPGVRLAEPIAAGAPRVGRGAGRAR
jgi:hypothetical protein